MTEMKQKDETNNRRKKGKGKILTEDEANETPCLTC